MRLFHRDPNTHAIQHEGVRYEQDEHGAFDLPDELATRLKEGFTHIWTDVADADDDMRDARHAHADAKAAGQGERKPAKRTQKAKSAEPTESDGDDSGDGSDDATPGRTATPTATRRR